MAIEYQKGDSALHRLDARTKLLMFVVLTVVAIAVVDPLLIAALFAGLYGLGAQAIGRRTLDRNLRVLIVIFLTFAAFQVFFFTPRDSYFLFYLIPAKGWVPVTVQGLVRGAAVFFRFFIVVLSVHLMLYTTPPVDLVLALTRRERSVRILPTLGIIVLLGAILFIAAQLALTEQVARLPLGPAAREAAVAAGALTLGLVLHRLAGHGLPPEMGLALSLGFATVGLLSQQAQKITDAQKARGYDIRPRNLIRRLQVLTALLLPIFLATLERSQDIAIAILARAFDYNIAQRTYRRELRFQTRDYLALALLIGLFLGSLSLDSLGLANPTESWILTWIRSRSG
jgi:energy-coupling factor transport system permease protein